MHHAKDGVGLANSISFVTLQCYLPSMEVDEQAVPIEVLDAEFFDEQVLVIVYRPFDHERGASTRSDRHEISTWEDPNSMLSGATSIATIGYADLVYEDAPSGYVTSQTREGLMLELLQLVKDGQVWVPPSINFWLSAAASHFVFSIFLH
jgi:anaphase-promoting complex subunit 4